MDKLVSSSRLMGEEGAGNESGSDLRGMWVGDGAFGGCESGSGRGPEGPSGRVADGRAPGSA